MLSLEKEMHGAGMEEGWKLLFGPRGKYLLGQNGV